VQPLVSAIIPTCNGEQVVEAAIESVLSQDYPHIELLVVVDGSTDRTAEVVRRFSKAVLLERPNGGAAAARNSGLARASGDLVAFLDHDDLWMPEKISKQVRYLEAHPDMDGVLTYLRHFIEEGLTPPAWLRPGLLDVDCLGYTPSTLMVRREVFSRIGVFQEGHRAEDADWFFRARDDGVRLGELAETLVMKRVHETNISSDQTPMLNGIVKVVRDSLARRRDAERERRNER